MGERKVIFAFCIQSRKIYFDSRETAKEKERAYLKGDFYSFIRISC